MYALATSPPPGPLWAWLAMAAIVPLALLWDLGLVGSQAKGAPTPATALRKTLAYAALAAAFALSLRIGVRGAPSHALGFASAYVVEMALSIDNLFVFMLLFDAFRVPPTQAHRVLNWGVAGALVMRATCIAAGAMLLQRFAVLFVVLGLVLVVTALKLLFQREDHKPDVHKMWPVLLFRRVFSVADDEASARHPGAFFVRQNGRAHATPLLLVLVAVEASDLIFALDSVPASFALTDEPYLVFAANVFAILGLRSLYFAMAQALGKLRFMRPALACVLAFVGVKMVLHGRYEVSLGASLGFILATLVVAAAGSALWPTTPKPQQH